MYTRSPVLSATVLNASADTGSLTSGFSVTTSFVFGWTPWTGGRSSGLGLVLLGDVVDEEVPVRLVGRVPGDELHPDEVDDPLERRVLAGRDGDDARRRQELLPDLPDAAPEVGPHAVELVDEGDPRHL